MVTSVAPFLKYSFTVGMTTMEGERLNAIGVPADERERQAWASYARVLFSSNEFLYLD